MLHQFELVKISEHKIIYRIDDFEMITAGFIQSLQWPEKICSMFFLFRNPIEKEHEVLSGLPHSVDVGIIYSMAKFGLKISSEYTANKVVQTKVPNAKELAKMYLACRSRIFAHTPEKSLPAVDMGDVLTKMENQINYAKIGYWEVRARPAGIIVVTCSHNYADVPVEWVPWVWIDESLLAEERKILHSNIRTWLTENIDKELQCIVNSFNVRSQKFFRKMGFIPECIRILKS